MKTRILGLARPQVRIRLDCWRVGLPVVIVGFLVLKLVNLSPRISDENWFFLAVRLVTQDIFPYRDYFFSHLPGQLLLYLPLMLVFGYHLYLLKFLAFLFTAATAVLLYLLLARRSNGISGIVAAWLFLFSPIVMWSSDFVSGVHEATFFLTLSWYLLASSPVWAGLALSAGLLTRQYILPAALGLVLWELGRGRYQLVFRYLVSAALPFLLVNLGLYLGFGEGFLTPAWRYHFLVKFGEKVGEEASLTFYQDNWIILLFSALGIWMLSGRRRRLASARRSAGESAVSIGSAALVSLLFQGIFLSVLRFLFQLYYVTLIPFLAVLGSLALTVFIPQRSRRLGVLVAGASVIFHGFMYQRVLASNAAFVDLAAVTSDIQNLTRKEDLLFGAYEIVPLLALETGRQIINNELDTNEQRYLAGLMTIDEATRLATESALFIQLGAVERASGDLVRIRPRYVDERVVTASCDLARTYELGGGVQYGVLLMWRCLGRL